jgi:hypothetical protein
MIPKPGKNLSEVESYETISPKPITDDHVEDVWEPDT